MTVVLIYKGNSFDGGCTAQFSELSQIVKFLGKSALRLNFADYILLDLATGDTLTVNEFSLYYNRFPQSQSLNQLQQYEKSSNEKRKTETVKAGGYKRIWAYIFPKNTGR